ncbi:peptidoglycan-recognition protein 2-like [Anthonomus grandis grandis]|uniref:peptidoglycan-recognition protein 2-like n=1 Tax=Anthonomus grandis grandis TaxID=2921223 RepID=UPI002165ED8D|nr:peptidoglycan-recognition protein 2-like [Anthonomus grandis grandis]
MLLILLLFYVLFESSIAENGSDWPKICPDIITRNRWNARTAQAVEYALIPVKNVIIHHTVTEECKKEVNCTAIIQEIQNFHIDILEFPDIGYNFLIGGDGNIYEGAGWHKVGAHTRGYNSRSVGIAFIGNFSDKLPRSKSLKALKDFLQCGVELGEIDKEYNLYGARQVSPSPTLSPGSRLFSELKTWPHFTNTT